MFGSGDMILHADAKADDKSMVAHAENFYALEAAVTREVTKLKSASWLPLSAVGCSCWLALLAGDRWLLAVAVGDAVFLRCWRWRKNAVPMLCGEVKYNIRCTGMREPSFSF